MNRDLSGMRENYKWGNLLIEQVEENPYDQFRLWLEDALNSKVVEANAMNLATVNDEGRPSSRIVLLKEIDDDGFLFYTNYESRKSQELDSHPFAALNFLWKDIERQVRIEGKVSRISRERSEAYFHSRPYGSQIGAISSKQSNIVEGREILEQRYKDNFSKYEKAGRAPLPENWGGFKVEADYFEFWQGRESRLHDRIVYKLSDGKWRIDRLEP